MGNVCCRFLVAWASCLNGATIPANYTKITHAFCSPSCCPLTCHILDRCLLQASPQAVLVNINLLIHIQKSYVTVVELAKFWLQRILATHWMFPIPSIVDICNTTVILQVGIPKRAQKKQFENVDHLYRFNTYVLCSLYIMHIFCGY